MLITIAKEIYQHTLAVLWGLITRSVCYWRLEEEVSGQGFFYVECIFILYCKYICLEEQNNNRYGEYRF